MPLHLVSVDEHSPAQRLGLEPGCTLLAIDGNTPERCIGLSVLYLCAAFHSDDLPEWCTAANFC